MIKTIPLKEFWRVIKKRGTRKSLLKTIEHLHRVTISEPIIKYVNNKNSLIIAQPNVFDTNETEYLTDKGLSNLSRVYPITNGYCFPFNGLCMSNHGQIFSDSVTGAVPINNNIKNDTQIKNVTEALNYQFFHQSPGPVVWLLMNQMDKIDTISKTIGTVLPLGSRFPNYYHWMINNVPRIRYVQIDNSIKRENITYLVPNNRPSWVSETIKHLGIESDTIYTSHPVYKSEKVLLTTAPRPAREDYNWIQSNIIRDKDRDYTPENNRIFISRTNAVKRRITNEKELMNMLSDYGFERYLLENNSIKNNALLFNNADFVIGPHGAGLTDLIFCRENTKIIELYASKYNAAYKNISDTMGLDYARYECEGVSTDIRVSVSKLEELIQERLE